MRRALEDRLIKRWAHDLVTRRQTPAEILQRIQEVVRQDMLWERGDA